MKTINVNVYQYSELSDKAKENARDWYQRGDTFDFEWDSMKEDAKNIGLSLTEWEYCCSINGDFIGSGRECAEKIIKEHGKTCETYKTAKSFLVELKKADKEYEKTGPEAKKEEVEAEFLKSLLEDYRIMTDKQFEYTQSEEAIAETMEANEYTFLENGTRFNG